MSWNYPQQITTGGREPGVGPITLSTSDPTLKSQVMGKVSDNGAVSVMVMAPCSVTIFYWSKRASAFVYGSSAETAYTKAFAGSTGGLDFFELPAGSYFALTSDTPDVVCYHDGDPV